MRAAILLVLFVLVGCGHQPLVEAARAGAPSVKKVIPTYEEWARLPACAQAVASVRMTHLQHQHTVPCNYTTPTVAGIEKLNLTTSSAIGDIERDWDERASCALVLHQALSPESERALRANDVDFGYATTTLVNGSIPLHRLACVAQLEFVDSVECYRTRESLH